MCNSMVCYSAAHLEIFAELNACVLIMDAH